MLAAVVRLSAWGVSLAGPICGTTDGSRISPQRRAPHEPDEVADQNARGGRMSPRASPTTAPGEQMGPDYLPDPTAK